MAMESSKPLTEAQARALLWLPISEDWRTHAHDAHALNDMAFMFPPLCRDEHGAFGPGGAYLTRWRLTYTGRQRVIEAKEDAKEAYRIPGAPIPWDNLSWDDREAKIVTVLMGGKPCCA